MPNVHVNPDTWQPIRTLYVTCDPQDVRDMPACLHALADALDEYEIDDVCVRSIRQNYNGLICDVVDLNDRIPYQGKRVSVTLQPSRLLIPV